MSQPAQAQHEAAKLAAVLADQATVFFAIHPVAGRMPGHMNVLLAEANVPYEDLKEMDAANPEFPTADVALVVGANDVTNPAARRRQSRPGRHHRSSQGGQLTKGREIDEDRKRRV
jgi:NAD/NADP transhydrogenase beta subunit